ncbi:PilZ domain-containing protein [Methylobacterium crusticola]|nr:PilZ domain-containing protein [Methylobacterium crusticola]
MAERRHIKRQPTSLRGRLILEVGRDVLECRVLDVTTVGANLEVPERVAVPARFDLLIGSGGTMRPCTIVWRRSDRIGVRFL